MEPSVSGVETNPGQKSPPPPGLTHLSRPKSRFCFGLSSWAFPSLQFHKHCPFSLTLSFCTGGCIPPRKHFLCAVWLSPIWYCPLQFGLENLSWQCPPSSTILPHILSRVEGPSCLLQTAPLTWSNNGNLHARLPSWLLESLRAESVFCFPIPSLMPGLPKMLH